jgi:hypothetical protein
MSLFKSSRGMHSKIQTEEFVEKVLEFLYNNSPGYKFNKLALSYHFPNFHFFENFENDFKRTSAKMFQIPFEKANLIFPGNSITTSQTKIMDHEGVFIGLDGMISFGTHGVVFGVNRSKTFLYASENIPYDTAFMGFFEYPRVCETSASNLFVVT